MHFELFQVSKHPSQTVSDHLWYIVEEVDLLEEVRKSKVKDNEVVKAIKEMKQAGVKILRDKEWREVDSVMYKEEKVYMPKDNKLRTEIIRLHHNTLVGGHEGQWKIVELVTRNFWWPGVMKEVKQYVEVVWLT